jgi:hypothetical protein
VVEFSRAPVILLNTLALEMERAKIALTNRVAGLGGEGQPALGTISWSSIGTPEKAVGLGQVAAKVAGSIAAAQNASASRRSPL